MARYSSLLSILGGFAIVLLACAKPQQAEPPVPIPFIWDFAGGEDMGLGAGFDIVNDMLQPAWVFNFSFNDGKTVKIGNFGFQIPDGVALASVSRYVLSNNTQLYSGFDDFWASMTKSASMASPAKFNNTVLPFAFSGTKAWVSTFNGNGARSISWNGAAYLTFSMQFRGSWRPPLSEFFQADIDNLPTVYDHDAYARFIGSWGTHYFTRAVYGSDFAFLASISNDFTGSDQRKFTTSQIDLLIKLNEFQYGMKLTKAVNASAIDPSISDATRLKVLARGGEPLKLTIEKNFTGWLDSCHTQKEPLGQYGDIEPLTDLIADPQKRGNLLRAIVAYGKTGKLLPPSPPSLENE